MDLGAITYCEHDDVVPTSQPFNGGQVFTPTSLADWVAEVLLECLQGKGAPTIIDPACGEGELLSAVRRYCPKAKVLGADIDRQVVATAASRLKNKSIFVGVDALIPERGVTTDTGWSTLPFPKKVDGVIANPPWGADLLHSHAEMYDAGYTLAQGQYDSWDLFVELSIKLLKRNGVAAFIIPDAIFLPEHQETREFLQKHTSILLVARLGEGFFKNVCRGTTVVVVRKVKPKDGHKVEAFRLDKLWRKEVLSSVQTLAEARLELSHLIEQKRFQNDAFSRWDIDAPEDEKSTIRLISKYEGEWTKWLTTGRGVEMSKRGKVLVCPKCKSARPAPRNSTASSCLSCGYSATNEKFQSDIIIKPSAKSKKGWMPLIVGEDVDRYSTSPNRAIRLDVEGINYKKLETYAKRRMLVRKTGVGLKAAITSENCMTNQVVFHYFNNEKHSPPDFYLSYVLGVFSSRVMFAYHLRTSGENEWRSHPYLTQKVISRLPVPLPVEGQASWRQAQAIATEVDKMIKKGQISDASDLRIEGLVAGLFGLTEDDMPWVKNVICSAQDLEPMRALQAIDLRRVLPLHVT